MLSVSLVAVGETGSSASVKAHAASSSVTFAEPPGQTPNWIFPFINPANFTVLDLWQWDWSMWRPVYYVGQGSTPNLDYTKSMAYAPVFSHNDSVITITLRNWNWSDGTPITSRNMLFWFNMLKAEKSNWFNYIPGTLPDDVKAVKIISAKTIQFTLTKSFNPTYYAQNELQSLSVMPMAWDRTSLAGSHGSGATVPTGTGAGLDMTTAGVKSVYNFLISQNSKPASYASNWLWQIVDGPYELKSYAVNGLTSLVANPTYGGHKASINEITFLPFTSASSEVSSLLSGSTIDVGYTTYADLKQQSLLSSHYSLQPWPIWGNDVLYINYNNPTVGPEFQQLYIRQAIQELIDQKTIIKSVYAGQATQTMGPVPLTPKTSYLTPYVASDPYQYNISSAIALLKAHGWNVKPGGSSTCAKPGTAANECGAGITAGEALGFTMQYSNGELELQTMHLVEKTDFAKAGIDLTLKPEVPGTLFSSVGGCTSKQALCSWQAGDFSDWTPFPFPTPATWCQTGSLYNFGSYHNSQLDALMVAGEHALGSAQLSASEAAAENMATKDLCILSEPVTPYQLTEIAKGLNGVSPQDVELPMSPEYWSYSK
jgi:peptide/nickel transport system substrate-binding protein